MGFLRGCGLLVVVLGMCQLQAREVGGVVVDAMDRPIAGALVSAARLETRSDAAGRFRVTLAAGATEVRVSAEGFLPKTVAAPVDGEIVVRLEIQPQRETLTVTESAGYQVGVVNSATKTPTAMVDIPQSITAIPKELIQDQMLASIGDVVRYVPGVASHQGENNRDQVVIRGNNSSADFFVNGVRDDVQYFRDLYNLERVEVLKGSNAMAFGRGGGGGVINRVVKEPNSLPLRELSVQGGQFGQKRVAGDVNQPLGSRLALRLNGMYENTESFRNGVSLERYGVAPTVSLQVGTGTRVTVGFEHFHDGRVADRGLPSFNGRPAALPIDLFLGDARLAPVRADVNLGTVLLDHQRGRLNVRNRLTVGDYDKYYQNFVPGAVAADRSTIGLSAYNNATARRNVFNQTDVTYSLSTGRVRHLLLVGAEAGAQRTGNFRATGYFGGSAAVTLPYSDPVLRTPLAFRQSATDADNRVRTNLGAVYVQDQMELSRWFRVIAGARFDYFDLRYFNNRNLDALRRIDHLVSPRVGVVLKPLTNVSVYASYGVSYLPSAGDQFSSLTTVTQQVKPERFNNYEVGLKWDLARSLSVTTALYRLDRTNTRSTDPFDPTRIVQTGAQRTNGYELGVNGAVTKRWTVSGGYAYQDAYVLSATTAARAGAQVAQVPHHTFSLWNKYQVMPRLGFGLGVLNRGDMFAAVDNTVLLPGYARADGAVFVNLTEKARLQANVENLFDRRYVLNADGNNNLSPGSPRAVRVGLTYRF